MDYDIKLDDREKLFPAPRQRFNWEGYVHSYLYNSGVYTMPVVNAKKIVEMFRCIPESRPDPETMDAGEAHGDPEGMTELLKNLLQMNKRKEAKQKMLLDAHGLKRKLEEEEQNLSAKCSRMATPSNGEGDEGQGRQKKF